VIGAVSTLALRENRTADGPMTKVVAGITMSLDGFVTGPDPDLEHGLGRGGEPLHA
jgi:hypothetical protein